MNQETIVRLGDVNKIYRQGELQVKAVDNLNLELHRGEFTALSGPSGSGKTTILNIIGGLDVPTSGTVELEGNNLAELSRAELSQIRRDRIGFIFQSYNLIPVMTAYENTEFVLAMQGVPKEQRRERVLAVLRSVGLEGLEHRRPNEMSGGQQQRVAISRAIVTRPAIVLADEPTANVDSHTAESLLDAMHQLNEEQGITFLFSTHDARVMDRARRLVRLLDGHIDNDERR